MRVLVGLCVQKCQCYLNQSSYLFVFLLVCYHWPRSQSMSTVTLSVSAPD